MAHRNRQRAKPDSLAKHANLKSYYETLTRLHERLTEFPYEEYLDQEVPFGECLEQEQFTYEPSCATYGRSKLEWEHGYYGAARFADGSTWYMEPGWEVGKCSQSPRLGLNLTNVESGSAPTSSTSPDSRPTSYVTYRPFKIWVLLDSPLKFNT